ncbi:MAG TPA: DUF2255 family protein [Pseudolysinimonas sp.]|jgi:hypothetical protein
MDSTAWNPATLAALAGANEVDVTPIDADGTRRARRTVWSIGVGDELYLRSWKGRGAVWFRDVLETGQGEIAVTGGGASQLVAVEEVDAAASVQQQISATFLTKYAADRYAGAMNEEAPVSATLRVLPR